MKRPISLPKVLSAIALSLLVALTIALTSAIARSGDSAPSTVQTANAPATPSGGNPCMGVCPNFRYVGAWDTTTNPIRCNPDRSGSGPRIYTRHCRVECNGNDFPAAVFRTYCIIRSY